MMQYMLFIESSICIPLCLLALWSEIWICLSEIHFDNMGYESSSPIKFQKRPEKRTLGYDLLDGPKRRLHANFQISASLSKKVLIFYPKNRFTSIF